MESNKIFYLPAIVCMSLTLLFYVMISFPIQHNEVFGTIKKQESDDNKNVKVVKKKTTLSDDNNKVKVVKKIKKAPFYSFTHEVGGFKISYPNHWEKNIGKLSVEFYPKLMNTDEVAPIVNVMLFPIPEKLTLTRFYNLEREHNDDGQLYESKRIYINDYPARMEVYTTEIPGDLTKIKEYWIFNNGKAWIIQYGATPSTYNKYLSTIDKMVNSFEVTR